MLIIGKISIFSEQINIVRKNMQTVVTLRKLEYTPFVLFIGNITST